MKYAVVANPAGFWCAIWFMGTKPSSSQWLGVLTHWLHWNLQLRRLQYIGHAIRPFQATPGRRQYYRVCSSGKIRLVGRVSGTKKTSKKAFQMPVLSIYRFELFDKWHPFANLIRSQLYDLLADGNLTLNGNLLANRRSLAHIQSSVLDHLLTRSRKFARSS
jgi:hypothetical protein